MALSSSAATTDLQSVGSERRLTGPGAPQVPLDRQRGLPESFLGAPARPGPPGTKTSSPISPGESSAKADAGVLRPAAQPTPAVQSAPSLLTASVTGPRNPPKVKMPPPTTSFYKRPLPPSCIGFASPEGKTLFAHALSEGNMDSYFPLASQFITQNEPAYCAIGTLCMILNALEIDPLRKWKGPWRWYDQSMLDCCRSLASIKDSGMTLSEFVCLSKCNGLEGEVISPDRFADEEAGLRRFRADLLRASRGEALIAYSYSRKRIGQTGDGHFSPIGGYSVQDDAVLVLDVARFKYPPYWLSVRDAWDAMKALDPATGKMRGYVPLRVVRESLAPEVAAPLSLTTLAFNKSSWSHFGADLGGIVTAAVGEAEAGEGNATPTPLLSALFAKLSTVLPNGTAIKIRQVDASQADASDEKQTRLKALESLAESPLGASVPEVPKQTALEKSLKILFVLSLFREKYKTLPTVLRRAVGDDAYARIAGTVDATLTDVPSLVGEELAQIVTKLEAMGECCETESSAHVETCGTSACECGKAV